ncbi:ATP-binding cassette domain-containing protein [Isachenkonia alkalipeptolytica]|uniref:ABC transporter ATP-binding protein n=1 Tax=Isachenkonia alkalipeptolytica TaxID=2565777 RepID=A0AA43XK45_9CLOT|nr:ATP-binding cassette domain-containing protein [Isachenkonia alkalipeptolytica]NBG88202.1 ABC transporter ATP-binding protein [Isachenkonia alkalipeptolytica]
MQRDEIKREDRQHSEEETEAMIELKNLTYRYEAEAVLQDLTTSLSSPKIYGLMGRNGAGKTTLLALINGYINRGEGSLKVFGENPFDNLSVAVDVSYHGKPDFKEERNKVEEILGFYRRYRPNFEIDIAKELLGDFDISLDKTIKKLSQGKQSALNGILGLASGTPVTLLDEVYVGMDAPSRTRMYRAILDEQIRRPRLMILSTHMVSEMDYLFDHVLILKNGKLLIDAPVDEVLEKGIAVSGEKSKVEDFTKDLQVLHREALGPIEKTVVYDEITEEDRKRGLETGLEFEETSLQDLFIHLTEGTEKVAGKKSMGKEDTK